MSNITKAIDSSDSNIGLFKKARASACKHCPMCNHARKNPKSLIGKILNHPLHTSHCPMWKAYEAVYGDQTQVRLEE